MATLAQTLLRLTKRLYPTGRAWRLPNDRVFERIHRALAVSEAQAYEAATSGILNTILPDNDNFTEEDASVWERRLAIIASSSTPLVDRKAAIGRKYAHPGNIAARQHQAYLEGQLQRAGFNVFVHENLTGQSPDSLVSADALTFGDEDAFFGAETVLGGSTVQQVVNSLDSVIDNSFLPGSDLRNSFFIGGQTLGTTANVPAVRETEFRQLILTLKPAQMVAFLFINYT